MNLPHFSAAARPMANPLPLYACLVLSACGNSVLSPTPVERQAPAASAVSAGERLAWDQEGSSPQEVSGYQYNLYVDGRPAMFGDVRCEPTPAQAGYPCSGALPSLAAGQHVLELSASARGIESPRSAALTVTAAAPVQGSDASAPAADPGL